LTFLAKTLDRGARDVVYLEVMVGVSEKGGKMISPEQRSLLYRTCKEAGVSFQAVISTYFRGAGKRHEAIDAMTGDAWDLALRINPLHLEAILEDVKSGTFFEDWSDEPDDGIDRKTAAQLRSKLYGACKKAGVNFKKLISERFGVKPKDAWDEALYIPAEKLESLIEEIEARAAEIVSKPA
jgi:hypothetical protein